MIRSPRPAAAAFAAAAAAAAPPPGLDPPSPCRPSRLALRASRSGGADGGRRRLVPPADDWGRWRWTPIPAAAAAAAAAAATAAAAAADDEKVDGGVGEDAGNSVASSASLAAAAAAATAAACARAACTERSESARTCLGASTRESAPAYPPVARPHEARAEARRRRPKAAPARWLPGPLHFAGGRRGEVGGRRGRWAAGCAVQISLFTERGAANPDAKGWLPAPCAAPGGGAPPPSPGCGEGAGGAVIGARRRSTEKTAWASNDRRLAGRQESIPAPLARTLWAQKQCLSAPTTHRSPTPAPAHSSCTGQCPRCIHKPRPPAERESVSPHPTTAN